jgi:hypothetical protein
MSFGLALGLSVAIYFGQAAILNIGLDVETNITQTDSLAHYYTKIIVGRQEFSVLLV